MTEQEWLTCTDPRAMLEFLRGKASVRKLRLCGVASCRRFWHKFSENRSRRAVEVAERYADALATTEELQAAHDEALQWDDLIASQDFEGVAYAREAAVVAKVVLDPIPSGEPALLRDIFGNPFRTITINPVWLTPTVVQLAQTIYDDRAFDRLPELAAALHEAGCDNEEILSHCRGPGPHVRGCWVLDLVLGKE